MKPIQLSPRLCSVAEMVPLGARLADVGTDHAYLPVWLLQRKVISHAVVSDLREGPLERAKTTAEKYGLTEQMDFRLCNGLSGILAEEVDTIAIAGMGGETIASILEAAPWTAQGEYRLLLQPMSAQNDLRLWLQQNSYSIVEERLSCEGNTLYTAFQVKPGTMSPLTPAECWAGRQHRGEEAPLRAEYLKRLIEQTGRALEGLQRSVCPAGASRQLELEERYQGLTAMLKEWNTWQQ